MLLGEIRDVIYLLIYELKRVMSEIIVKIGLLYVEMGLCIW